MTTRVVPFANGFGAEITGADFSKAIDAEAVAAIKRAILDHHVVTIRDQQLDPHQTVALSRCFGEVEPHVFREYHHPETPFIVVLSNRVENSKPVGLADAGSFWHSDVSFKERPAKATMLYALEVPDQGGDTLFCNMIAAYEALPEAMKARLDGLFAVHDYTLRDARAPKGGTRAVMTEEHKRAAPPVRHPVVRVHPESGRKALYINPTYTRCIEGLDATDSDALMQTVFDHCLKDAFRMRYKWRAGDVLIWDNAAVMHAATTAGLSPSLHRTLWRTIIVGDRTH